MPNLKLDHGYGKLQCIISGDEHNYLKANGR